MKHSTSVAFDQGSHEMYFSCCSCKSFAEDLASRQSDVTSSISACQKTEKKQEINSHNIHLQTALSFEICKEVPCRYCHDHSFSPRCWQETKAEPRACKHKKVQRERKILQRSNDAGSVLKPQRCSLPNVPKWDQAFFIHRQLFYLRTNGYNLIT